MLFRYIFRLSTLRQMSLACIRIIYGDLLDSSVCAGIVDDNPQWKKGYPCARIDKNNKKKDMTRGSSETAQNKTF